MTFRHFFSISPLNRLFLLVLAMPLPAWSWNAAGHRLIASIAWEHLDSQARSEAVRLLRLHPDYQHWIRHGHGEDADQAAFIEASTWPDDIRHDARFYDAESDTATAIQPGFADMRRHRSWHYVNRPFAQGPGLPALSGKLDRQLGTLSQTLTARGGLDQEREQNRVYALPWLIHLVGDAHQPLHAIVQSQSVPGISPTIINPFNPRKNTTTLHAFWDDLPGPPWLRGKRLKQAAQALIALYPRPVGPVDTDAWLTESWQIAQTQGFPLGEEEPVTLSADFFINGRETANRRVTEAGYRLADWLNALLGTVP